MIQALVATLMWALVASLLIFRRKRADRSITYASCTIAVAMTLNVDAIYLATDPLLGGTNVTTLVSDGLLMTGIFFLGRGVMKVDEYRPQARAGRRGRPGAPHIASCDHHDVRVHRPRHNHDSVHDRPRRATRSSGVLDHQLQLLLPRHHDDDDPRRAAISAQLRHPASPPRLC